MRKIEREMLDALMSGRTMKVSNTEVRYAEAPDGEVYGEVYLFGNHIARVRVGPDKIVCVYPDIRTLRRCPTRTTISRLRALGVDVSMSQWRLYLDGVCIDG